MLTGSSPSTGSSTQVDQSSGFLQKLKFTVELDEFEGRTRAITWKRQKCNVGRQMAHSTPLFELTLASNPANYANIYSLVVSRVLVTLTVLGVTLYLFLSPNGRIYPSWFFQLWVSSPCWLMFFTLHADRKITLESSVHENNTCVFLGAHIWRHTARGVVSSSSSDLFLCGCRTLLTPAVLTVDQRRLTTKLLKKIVMMNINKTGFCWYTHWKSELRK